jgi:hypothetical protein
MDGGYVLPPTPPPDIDLEAWRASIDRLEAWGPATLFMTHFGPAPSVRPHLGSLLENLETTAGWVRETLAEEGNSAGTGAGTDEERSQRFAARLRRSMRQQMTEAEVEAYPVAAPFEQLWFGLARYWRKKAA